MKDITVTAGTSMFSIPSDFGIALGVAVHDSTSSDGYVALDRMEFEQRYADGYDNAVKTSARWDIFGSYLRLQPQPTWSGAVRLEYVKSFAPTGLSSQTVDVENSWQEWITCDVCAKVCAKEETDPSVFMAQQKACAERITAVKKTENNISSEARSPSPTGTTLADIRRAVRARGGWQIGDISDSVLTGVINSAMRGLEDLILGLNPMHSALLDRSYIVVTSGTGLYSLPTTLHTLFGVSVKDESKRDGYAVLERFNWEDRADGYSGSDEASARWFKYGSQLMIEPIPNWDGTLRIEYAKQFTISGSPTQSFTFENSWHEWIIVQSCVMLCPRTKTDPAAFVAQLADIEKRIAGALRTEEMITQTPRRGAPSTTLEDLRRSVRGRGSWMRTEITDTQLTEWLNASIRSMVDLMILRDPSFFVSRDDITVISGTRSYALPSDMWRLLGVSVEDSSSHDGYTIIQRYEWDERYDTVWSSEKFDTRYMVVGTNLELHPTPCWSGKIRLEYAPYPTTLSNPYDTFNFRNGLQEWVILDTAAKAAISNGKDPSAYMASRDAEVSRISTTMVRDAAKPKTVIDTYRRGGTHRIRRMPWSTS
jgi:hypothetical protein